MPLYEYEYDTCGHRFEVIQKFSDTPLTECPKCQGPVRKLPSSPAIQFKGSGFYITDYAKKSSTAAGSAKGEGAGSGSGSSSSEGSGEKSGEKSSGSSSTGDAASKTDSGTKATKPTGT
jgi:putative FmdB family regulatory protein